MAANVTNIERVAPNKLKPYDRNAKIHTPEQVEKIARSIKAFGFLSPVLIDRDFNIIAGHGRVMAAQKLGLKSIPAVYVEGLTDAERRAYILADNRLGELAEWRMELVYSELGSLADDDFEIDLTGFEMPEPVEWFTDREYEGDSTEGESEEYTDFVEKFKPKKTTDDCYTPPEIYEAVKEWALREYNPAGVICRPFYPGGDYTKEDYRGKVVIDNPPFSILSEIVNFYTENKVQFFLFAPALTFFNSAKGICCAIAVGSDMWYENGANVKTSFLTNMEPAGIRSAPDLYKKLKTVNDRLKNGGKEPLPVYKYPPEVVTAAALQYLSVHGEALKIPAERLTFIRELDAQKEVGKQLFGGGFLLSERAASERAASERAATERAARIDAETDEGGAVEWTLSEREREIIRGLSDGE